MVDLPYWSISHELLGKQEGFYVCRVSFPRFFILNIVTECLFRSVEYNSNVCQDTGLLSLAGWDLRC